jgi:hypothetical protein
MYVTEAKKALPLELTCGKCGSERHAADLESVISPSGAPEWRCINKGFCDWAWEYAHKRRGGK